MCSTTLSRLHPKFIFDTKIFGDTWAILQPLGIQLSQVSTSAFISTFLKKNWFYLIFAKLDGDNLLWISAVWSHHLLQRKLNIYFFYFSKLTWFLPVKTFPQIFMNGELWRKKIQDLLFMHVKSQSYKSLVFFVFWYLLLSLSLCKHTKK